MKRFVGSGVLVGVAVAGLVAARQWPARSAEIAIDPELRFQTMSGWEATADLPASLPVPEWEPYSDKLLDTVVAEIGINRVRLEVRSGAETRSDAPTRYLAGELSDDDWRLERYNAVNDNDDPLVIDPAGFNFDELDWHVRTTVLPLRSRLEARGEALVVNLCYVSFRDGWYFHMEPEEYAEFVLATYQHLDRTFGFVPDLWEVILEPDLPDDGWTGEVMGRAMAAAAKRLEEHGYRAAFVAPSVVNMSHAVPYARAILSVPGAAEHYVELSYHRYRGTSPRALAGIASFALANGLRTAMLEWWFGKGTHEVLYEDLTVGMNSAWQGRVVNGLVDATPTSENGTEFRIAPKPEVRYNLLYFGAIRAGDVRIGAESTAPRDFAPVAFQDPAGGVAVVVEAAHRGEIAFTNLPPGPYDVTMALRDRNVALPEPVLVPEGGKMMVEMPGAGVLSVVAQ